MAHTFINPTESGGGAWHREVPSATKGATVKTAFVPTGGWRSTPVNGGLGAIISGSYAQQAGIGAILSNQYPQASVLPGMWASGTPAGGTVAGTHKRSQQLTGYGQSETQKQADMQAAVKLAALDARTAQLYHDGKIAEAEKVAAEADALRATLNASGGDWMNLLRDAMGAGVKAYGIRQRQEEGEIIVPQTPREEPSGSVRAAPRPRMRWGVVGVAALVIAGVFVAPRFIGRKR